MQTSRMSLELELDTNYSGRCAGHRSAGEPDIISLMYHVGLCVGPITRVLGSHPASSAYHEALHRVAQSHRASACSSL